MTILDDTKYNCNFVTFVTFLFNLISSKPKKADDRTPSPINSSIEDYFSLFNFVYKLSRDRVAVKEN